MVLLHPKRKTEAFRVDADKNLQQTMNDPALEREAISFYAGAAYVFRNGLYRSRNGG